MSIDRETSIVALSSGPLPAGVAVLRLSGPQARLALDRLAGGVPEARRAGLRTFRDAEGRPIDRGLALFFPGPATVTGEDLAEFHLHGGRAVVAACLEALCALPGVRLALAGEFTRRAFENGRIDLTEAEGLADLLAAETEGQRRRAFAEADGALRRLYDGWHDELTRARAMIEAGFDFADEDDVPEAVAGDARAGANRIAASIREHLDAASRGEILRDGFRVAIAGAPNAGKSSLLNHLAGRDLAIVSAVPGTTRDVLEVTVDLAGLPVRFFDTAGIRETEDTIEAIGVERAHRAMADADLVLLLREPGGVPTHVKHGRPALRIATKADRGAPDEDADLAISTTSGEGLADLLAMVAAAAGEAVGDPDAVLPTRARHREILREVVAILGELDTEALPLEIVAETLRRAAGALGRLTGSVGVEDLLDVIFADFCVGK